MAIVGMDELSEEDKALVFRSCKMKRFTSEPFKVAEVFTGLPGSFVPLTEYGVYDGTPVLVFYIGGTDEIESKVEKLRLEHECLAKIQAERDQRQVDKNHETHADGANNSQCCITGLTIHDFAARMAASDCRSERSIRTTRC